MNCSTTTAAVRRRYLVARNHQHAMRQDRHVDRCSNQPAVTFAET